MSTCGIENRNLNVISRFPAVLFLIFLIVAGNIPAKETESRGAPQFVTIQVRVMHHGIPVDHLTKDDFMVYSGESLQTITAFDRIRRTVFRSPQPSSPPVPVLVCDITDCNHRVRTGIGDIFNSLPGNRIQPVILINGYRVFFNRAVESRQALEKTMGVIRRHSRILRSQAASELKKSEDLISYLRQNTRRTAGDDEATRRGGKIHRHYYMKYFKSILEQYLEALKAYLEKYVEPRLDPFQSLFTGPGEIPANTPIFYLYQTPDFPGLSKKNRSVINKMKNDLSDRDWTEAWMDELDYAKKINKILGAIDHQLGLDRDFQTDAFVDFFFMAESALFPLYLGPPENSTPAREGGGEKMARINHHWKKVSAETGGRFIDLNLSPPNTQALNNHVDIRYRLSFIPQKTERATPIRIEMKEPGYRLIYRKDAPDKQKVAPKIQGKRIHISEAHFSRDMLSFSLKNFEKKVGDQKSRGELHVRIQITGLHTQPLLDTGKVLKTEKSRVDIAIDLPALPRENLRAIIDVTDLISQITVIDFIDRNPRTHAVSNGSGQ